MTGVDVMMPHYGRRDLAQETVRSVLAQDDPNWRLTIVDDSGDRPDDGFGSWCAELGDPRVRYRRNERNLGINRNFQRCVTLVEQELAVIVGSDDLMLPGYVGTVRRAYAAHPEVGIVQPGVEVVDERGERVRTLTDLTKRWVYAPRAAAPTVLAGEDLAVEPAARELAVLPLDLLAGRAAAAHRVPRGPVGRAGPRPGAGPGAGRRVAARRADRVLPLPAAPHVGVVRAGGRRAAVRRGAARSSRPPRTGWPRTAGRGPRGPRGGTSRPGSTR